MDNINDPHWSDLLFKKLTGIATLEEEAYIDELIANNAEVRAEWEKMSAEYHDPQVQARLSSIDVNDKFEKFMGKHARRFPIARYAVAATVLILIAAGTIYYFTNRTTQETYSSVDSHDITLRLPSGKAVALSDSGTVDVGHATIHANKGTASFETSSESSTLNTLTVPKGKRYILRLSDGTTVQLNAESAISFPFTFTGHSRQISIKGEAYLHVGPDPAKPFIVKTEKGTIEVLGTTFNVNTYKNLTVSLLNGAVAVKNEKRSVKLVPGREVEVDSLTGEMSTRDFDPDTKFGWLNGKYYFDEMPLKDIIAIIQRHYDIKIFIERRGAENFTYNGVLDTKRPLSKFIEYFDMSHGQLKFSLDNQGNLHIR